MNEPLRIDLRNVTKRYDRRKKMTADDIEKFLVQNYGQPALLK